MPTLEDLTDDNNCSKNVYVESMFRIKKTAGRLKKNMLQQKERQGQAVASRVRLLFYFIWVVGSSAPWKHAG